MSQTTDSDGFFLTLDLEDFSAYARRSLKLPAAAPLPFVVERGVDLLLSTLGDISPGSHITVFTTAEIARTRPQLVRSLAAAGHEIACHSYEHEHFATLNEPRFRELIHRATSILEDVIGAAVIGFRAPSFSLRGDMHFGFECLKERGYHYDSSVLMRGRRTATEPYDLIGTRSGPLAEFPIPVFKPVPGMRIRVVGGTYFRILPAVGIEYILRRAAHDGFTPIVWLHPSDLFASFFPVSFREACESSIAAALRWPFDQGVFRAGAESVPGKLRHLLFRRRLRGKLCDVLPASRRKSRVIPEL